MSRVARRSPGSIEKLFTKFEHLIIIYLLIHDLCELIGSFQHLHDEMNRKHATFGVFELVLYLIHVHFKVFVRRLPDLRLDGMIQFSDVGERSLGIRIVIIEPKFVALG